MRVLTDSEISAIDKAVDAEVDALRIFTFEKETSLYHLLLSIEAMWAAGGPLHIMPGYTESVLRLHDALNYAAQWIHSRCKTGSGHYSAPQPEEFYTAIAKLLQSAEKYSQAWDMLSMLFRREYVATVGRNADVIHINWTDKTMIGKAAAAHLLCSSDAPVLDDDKVLMQSEYSYAKIANFLQHNSIDPEKLLWMPGELFRYAYMNAYVTSSHVWELPPSWTARGYSVKQLSRTWRSILALLVVAEHFGGIAFLNQAPSPVAILRANRTDWITRIAEYSGIDPAIVALIITDLTYDPNLYKGKLQPDVKYQPFFDIGEELLLPLSLALTSNMERNWWHLLSILDNDRFSQLSNLKEDAWRDSLIPHLSRRSWRVIPGKRVTLNGQSTNADLIIVDDRRKQVLAMELKWFMGPDAIKQVVHCGDELKIGLGQVQLVLDYLSQRNDEVATLTGVAVDELREYKIDGAVLSKNTLGMGKLLSETLPVINEHILITLLDVAGDDLSKLTVDIHRKGYLPKPGRDYGNSTMRLTIGGKKFIMKAVGMRYKQEPNVREREL